MSKGETKIKQVDIDRQSLVVAVNGLNANFVRKNYLERVVPDDEYDHDIKAFTARYKAALHASDQGDLIVELPQGVTIQESNDVAPTDNDSKVGNGSESHHVIRTHHSFSPLIVRVHYQLVQPRAGAYFVLPTETAYSRRVPHMYTHNQEDNGARAWMPTVDHVGERCSWEMEITVAQGQIAVASGELLEQVWVDDEETKKTFYYKQSVPVPARSVALAVGPFVVYPDPHVPSITHFCLPGRIKELQYTVDFLGKAYRFYEEFLHTPFPFESYKQVFVEDAYSDVSSCASLSICSSHLLHDETIIDQTLVTRRLLALALAQQWFQCYVGVKSWPDMWISAGVSGYLAGLFFRRMFGNNEYRYRLMMESEWVCGADTGPPLYNEHAAHPHDMQTELVARKAPLVMYMMERRVGETSFRKLLNGLVAVKPATSATTDNKDPLVANTTSTRDGNGIIAPNTTTSTGNPAPTKESVDQTLSTKKLLKTIKLETGQDMKSFAEKWIYGKGCPKFACGFWFNRKRHQTEFALRQTNKPDDRISSSLTIRINELDGSYDNVIQFDEEMHAYEFPCFSRVRKSRKKKKDGDDKETETVVATAPGSKKTETPLLWIRIDPDMEWIHSISFKQPEYMWVHQLEEDRDVVAQHDAIRGLQLFATSNALGALNRVVNNALVFYRVRMEAAYSLSFPSSSSTSSSSDQPTSADVHWIGLDHLLRTFKTLFFNADGTQLLPNTFADFCNYHLQKILPLAMAQVQDKEGRTPSDVLEFLLDLLKNNDNSLNAFSDNYYLESVILAVSKTNTTGLSDTDKIAKQIHRYLNMERLMPSYHNTVTVACIKALGDLQCARKLDASSQVFKDYSRYGHFDEVRVAAATALARLGFAQLKDPAITDKLLTFAESDPSPRMRARILDILASPVASEERAYFDALYPSIDRVWTMVNGSITALDSRVRGAALRLHQAVLSWGKQYGVVPDIPSQSHLPMRNPNNPIKVRAIMGGGAPPSLGPGKKLLPKAKASTKRKQDEVGLPKEGEPLKIIFKTSEGSPPTTTSHNPPTSIPTPPLASSTSPPTTTPAPKRRKQSNAPVTKTPQTPQTPSPAPSPTPSPSIGSHPPIKEEPPTPPPHKAPKRTSQAQQPLSPPPSTPSHPPPASRTNPPPPQTPTPAPPPASAPAPSPSPAPSTPAPANPAGSLKIKLKLGGVRLQDPNKP